MIGRVVAALALVACRHDVQLGVAVDGAADAVDGNGNPFTSGSYPMAFLDPAQRMCDGTLVGMDASFTAITRASLGLVDGTVTFATPTATTLTIAGTPIMMALGQPSLDLMPSMGSAPFWDGLVSGDFTTGPLGTMRTATDLAADSTTATAPMIDAQLAVLYTTVDGNGSCTVAFGVAFTHP
jgi:hypothetical protein